FARLPNLLARRTAPRTVDLSPQGGKVPPTGWEIPMTTITDIRWKLEAVAAAANAVRDTNPDDPTVWLDAAQDGVIAALNGADWLTWNVRVLDQHPTTGADRVAYGETADGETVVVTYHGPGRVTVETV